MRNIKILFICLFLVGSFSVSAQDFGKEISAFPAPKGNQMLEDGYLAKQKKYKKKLAKYQKKYKLTRKQADAKNKVKSGMAVGKIDRMRYKKALRKEAKLNRKSEKLIKKSMMDKQAKSTKKEMKRLAKNSEKRRKQARKH